MQRGDVLVERFEIESFAGAGGMGAVYRAHDRVTSQPVALKVLGGRGNVEPERFRRESLVLSELDHPAIVRHVAHGTTPEGVPYLAMEWLDGEDLQMRLGRAPLSIGECITLAARVADALAVAHAHGVVHRDIKPNNLFLVEQAIDKVKLLDFGIARVADATQTAADTTLGTPEYMSPEQARGARDVDARTDVFSLGCVLFECLTGRPAFAGHQLMALLARVLLEEAPRLREIRAEIPEALDALVARMLSKDPAGRPRDGAALAEELRSLDSLSQTDLRIVPAPATITKAEQRVLSVVLVQRPAVPDVTDPSGATVVAGDLDLDMDACRATVQGHGGTLERLADGTLIATLAGTRAATDQAVLAARCALALRALAPSAEMSLATGRGGVSVRGPVGGVIERAARLLPRSKEGAAAVATRAIRLDEVTAGLLDARFEVGGDARGLALRSEREVVESTRTLLGREGPCVGRDRELGMLEGLFDECAGEPLAHAVLVTGAAGIGKSRLRFELLHRLEARPDGAPQVWLARGDPLAVASPFGLLARALRQTAGLFDGEALALRRQKLRARVARNVPLEARARVTDFLGELVGTPLDDAQSVQLRAARQDAMLMGDQMRRAWEDFVQAECEAGPLVIVLEDLQWGDLPTVSFVDGALRSMHDRPLMVLALARPDVRESFPRLWSERSVTHIQLDSLTKKASERLIREFLGNIGDDALARLVERAAGNPFYLEEVIRSVAEGRGEDFPETVLAMVQTRLEGLEPTVRRVLRAASIFGQAFWRGGVAALLGADEVTTPLDEILRELVDKEVIARRGKGKFPGEDEYVFRHTQLREAALQMLMEADRALGHRLAGAWLETAGESDPAVLAAHFERGGEPERAIAGYRRAAEQALGGNDFALACSRAARGIACGARGEVLGALHLLTAEARRWRGETREALVSGLAAMGALEPGGTPWHAAAGEVAVASLKLGELPKLVEIGELIVHWAPNEPAALGVVSAHARAALQLLSAGKKELGSAIVDRLQAVATTPGIDPLALAWIRRVQAWRAHFSGDVEAHLALVTSSAERFEEAGDVRNGCTQRMNEGIAMTYLGQYARAEAALRNALENASRLGLAVVAAAAKHALGSTLRRVGRTDEARAVEREAAEAFQTQGDRRMEAGCRIYLSAILLQRGTLDAAEREARRAVELCDPTAASRVSALEALAQVQLARGASGDALATAREAMALFETLGGMEEGEAALRLVHAEALEACGLVAEARVAIAAARARLNERASRITSVPLRQSFLTHVAENAGTVALSERLGA
jgi:tetratricopeptide (TPR) repeat protein